MPKKRLNLSTAYGQLLVLVFLPIVVLAGVGSLLVYQETSQASASRQQALATSALIRYEPTIRHMLPQLLQTSPTPATQTTAIKPATLATTLDAIHENVNERSDNHVLQVVIIDDSGEVITSDRPDFQATQAEVWQAVQTAQSGGQSFIAGFDTSQGTAYGHQFATHQGKDYWLFVEMDDEPRTIASLKVVLVLSLTALFTLLMLLLSITVYSKRWIAPIYDLRLHLNQLTSNNLHKPISTQTNGELNQLQQDLVKALRRLHGEFQELRTHAEQTEDDLRIAFDDMEMKNILIREARDKAVSTSHMKSAFLANISHELRTPLNSIDGFINLLARHGNLSTEQDMYVQTIRKSSAHLLALVNDVLDFSKIEAGKLVLDVHEVDLYATVYDVLDMLSPLAADKGLRMAVLYYDDVPRHLVSDALRIKQILTNLVGNAIKFTDTGDVVVRVSLAEADEHTDQDPSASAKSHIVIEVKDSGHGVAEERRDNLFKSFTQGDPSITRQYGGTGLGLVISKQLTRLLGGEIGYYPNEHAHHIQHTHHIQHAHHHQHRTTAAHGQIEPFQNQSFQNQSLGGNANSTMSPAVITTNTSGSTFWFSLPVKLALAMEADNAEANDPHIRASNTAFGADTKALWQLPTLSEFDDYLDTMPTYHVLVWLNHVPSLNVFMAAMQPLMAKYDLKVTRTSSLASTLDKLKEQQEHWDWVVVDEGDSQSTDDQSALLKQIRLHYQGKLAVFGYQVALNASLLGRYQAKGLYQPLDRRQIYELLDTKKRQPHTQPASKWQHKTVLAVDDHLPNLLVLEALLIELDIHVMTASSGADAIAMLTPQILSDNKTNHETTSHFEDKPYQSRGNTTTKIQNIDLVFMDIQMPKMSGHETAERIRQLEQEAEASRRLPIIALSAHGLADEKQRLLASGMDDYVSKPISRPQLLQILQRWLGGGKQVSTFTAAQTSMATPMSTLEGGLPQSDSPSLSIANTSDTLNTANGADVPTPNPSTITDDEATHPASHRIHGELAVVDWHDALSRSANKPDLAWQLLTMMQDTVSEELKNLQHAWQNKQREMLAQIAHRILGASRYTGVPQVRESSQRFEDKCLLNPTHVTPAQFDMLEPAYQALVESLKRLQAVDLIDPSQFDVPTDGRQHPSHPDASLDKPTSDTLNDTLSENDMTWKMI